MIPPPDPGWAEGELSRLADNSIRGLAERLAMFETGADELCPTAYRRALEHLRLALEREETALPADADQAA